MNFGGNRGGSVETMFLLWPQKLRTKYTEKATGWLSTPRICISISAMHKLGNDISSEFGIFSRTSVISKYDKYYRVIKVGLYIIYMNLLLLERFFSSLQFYLA